MRVDGTRGGFPFVYEIMVDRYLSGRRIDGFLQRHLRNYTPYRIQRMVQSGHVTIDATVAPVTGRVYLGQRVQIRLVEPPDKLIPAEPGPLEILYEDRWLMVVNKPPGQIVHPVGSFQTGTLVNALQWYLDRQSECRGLLRPGIVHRLDQYTSGVMAVPREYVAHRLLALAFEERRVRKSYLALVEGRMTEEAGTIDRPIGMLPGGQSVLMSCGEGAEQPRKSRTDFRVLQRFDGHTLVEAFPWTGRLHQIRVHLSHLGHPVVDDEYYGAFGAIKQPPKASALSVKLQRESSGLVGRQALHARQLELVHPMTGETLSFEAPLPEDLGRALRVLGGEA